jgi:hypothetical protein
MNTDCPFRGCPFRGCPSRGASAIHYSEIHIPTNTTHSIVKQRGHCAPPRGAAPTHNMKIEMRSG